MLKLLVLFLTPLILLAQNPKIYSSVGDPLYDDLKSILKLSDLHSFKPHREAMKRFVTEVQEAKSEGFALDRQKDQDRAKTYLEALRALSKRNIQWRRTIKEVMAASIRTDFEARYRQIIGTNHPLFREDPELKRLITGYQRVLNKRAAEKARKHVDFLRTHAHFNGTWNTPSQQWIFKGNKLTTVKHDGKQKQVSQGTWKFEGPHLVHHVTAMENSYNDRNKLFRETDTLVYYTLIQLRSGELDVKDVYSELLELKKQ
jgi:hypothetical protein